MPGYALIMYQYVWTSLNNPEYDWICRHISEKNKVLNMPEFWPCQIQYKAWSHCTIHWVVIETETYSEHCQTFTMECFAKRTMPELKCTTRNFLGHWGKIVYLEHFDKHFVKNTRKRGPKGKYFWNFCPTLKTRFWMTNLRWTQLRPLFSKSGHFFGFQKEQGRPPISSLVARLWIWLNVHQYLWTCLNTHKKSWINCSDFAGALNMHHHLTRLTAFEDVLGSK